MDDTISTTAEAHETTAIPQRREIHIAETPMPEAEVLPEAVTKTPVEQKSPARWAYERLILYIQKFEQQLDAEQEVAMGFAGGEAGVLRIEGLGYFDPDLITFYGQDGDGMRTQLIQHVTQLSVVLTAMPKESEAEEPRRIGFRLVRELDKG